MKTRIQIFISHSVAPRELAIVNAVADVAASKGAVPIISYRNWDPIGILPGYIESQITSSNYVIGIITNNGHHLDWINAEIAYSQKMNRPILVLADEGINISSQDQIIRIDRTNPMKTLFLVSAEIQRLIGDEEVRNLVGGLVIGGLILPIFFEWSIELMPVLEIEEIYQTKEEIEEYRKAIGDSENWRFIANRIWDFGLQQILEKIKISDRELKAWNKLYGFLDDLTPEEWQQFDEAIRRRPLFEKKRLNES